MSYFHLLFLHMKIDCLKALMRQEEWWNNFNLQFSFYMRSKESVYKTTYYYYRTGACYGTTGPSSIHCIITVFCEEDGEAAESFGSVLLFDVTCVQNLQILMSLGLWLLSNSRIHLNAVYSHCPQKILWQLLFAFGLITKQKEGYIYQTRAYIYHDINSVQSSFLQR